MMRRRKYIPGALIFAILMMANTHTFAASAGQQIQPGSTFKKAGAGDRDVVSGNEFYAATPLLTHTKQTGKHKTISSGGALPRRIYEPLTPFFLSAGFTVKETGRRFDHRLLYLYPFHYFW